MSKILITGAAGFIGSHLLDFLLELKISNRNIRLLIWDQQELKNLAHLDLNKFEIVYGDIRDKKIVVRAMKNVTDVFHLAAKVDFDGKNYHEYRATNVLGTKNLLDQAVKNKNFHKFVAYSSIAVHGLPAAVGNIINWDEMAPPLYDNFYGRSKWEMEILIRHYHRLYGLKYIIIRPASVYGPRENGPTLALVKAIKNKQFMMIGDGQNKMHYVYVQDLVAATYLAWKSKLKQGEYIIAGPDAPTLEQVVANIYRCLSKDAKFCVSIPKSLALFLAYVLDWLSKMTDIKFPLYPSRVRTMTTTYYYNLDKAKRELNYKPKVKFKDGIKELCASL